MHRHRNNQNLLPVLLFHWHNLPLQYFNYLVIKEALKDLRNSESHMMEGSWRVYSAAPLAVELYSLPG
jgi:hypothetical protein